MVKVDTCLELCYIETQDDKACSWSTDKQIHGYTQALWRALLSAELKYNNNAEKTDSQITAEIQQYSVFWPVKIPLYHFIKLLIVRCKIMMQHSHNIGVHSRVDAAFALIQTLL